MSKTLCDRLPEYLSERRIPSAASASRCFDTPLPVLVVTGGMETSPYSKPPSTPFASTGFPSIGVGRSIFATLTHARRSAASPCCGGYALPPLEEVK